jgi:hypothetical protein
VEAAQPGAIQQRLRSVEQRPEQRCELGHRLRRLSRAEPERKRQESRHPHALTDQAALPHAGLALDQKHPAGACAKTVEVLAQHGELRVPPADRRAKR